MAVRARRVDGFESVPANGIELDDRGLYSERMSSTETRQRTWITYVRRLLAALSADWLVALLDIGHLLAHWLAWKHEGLYEILSYESSLDLTDAQGKRAIVRKQQRVRFLQNDIAAFQDFAYGDGQIFAGYKVSPGVAADRYRDGDRWHVLISLRATKNRGDVEDFLLERTIEDGFKNEEEWWQVELRHPTRWLRLSIVFPKERPCRSASLVQRSRHRTWELGPEHFTKLPDGHQQLRWETVNIRPLEVYTVRWTW